MKSFLCLIFCHFNLLIKMLYKVKNSCENATFYPFFLKKPIETIRHLFRRKFCLISRIYESFFIQVLDVCCMKKQRVSTQEIFYCLMRTLCQNASMFVLTIRKSKEPKYSSIVLPQSIEIDRSYHLTCYRRFIALSQQQREKIGERWGSGSQNKTVLTPANIRLDEDVLKTSFVFVFRRRLQDVFIKTNMFTLASRLQKTSSRHLQDFTVKINIFVLAIRLQDVFKSFSRRLQDVLAICLQDVLKNVFKTSSRRIAKISSRRFQDVSSS